MTVKTHVVVRKQIHTDATVNIEKDEWWQQHKNNSTTTIALPFLGIPNNQGYWRETWRFALRSINDLGLGKQSLDQRIKNEAFALAQQFYGRHSQAFDPHDDIFKAVSNIICSVTFGKR